MEVALQAQFNKENIGNGRWYGNRGRGTFHDYGGRDFQNPNKAASQKGEGRKNMVDQIITIKVVGTITEEVERLNLTRTMPNAIVVKSFGIMLINAMTTRNIHKKMKQILLCKKMMMKTPC